MSALCRQYKYSDRANYLLTTLRNYAMNRHSPQMRGDILRPIEADRQAAYRRKLFGQDLGRMNSG
jgi:hypothetical protein